MSIDEKLCHSIPIKCTHPFPKVISSNTYLKGFMSSALLWATVLPTVSVSLETQSYLCQGLHGCSLK